MKLGLQKRVMTNIQKALKHLEAAMGLVEMATDQGSVKVTVQEDKPKKRTRKKT